MKRTPVAVTGVGLVTSLGVGVTANWRRLVAGESGVSRVTRFPTDGLLTTIGASVDFLDLPCDASIQERAIAMGNAAVDEALQQAGFSAGQPFDGDAFLAPPVQDMEWPRLVWAARGRHATTYVDLCEQVRRGMPDLATSPQTIAIHYACRHRLSRLPVCVTTACASGASALQYAVETLRRGEVKRALVLGTDGAVRQEMLVRFSLLSALSTANDEPQRASKPFSIDRDGFVIGEGAGALVLEQPDEARARGVEILANVLGCGEAGDNFHRTRSNPDAGPIVGCMGNALLDAGLVPGDVEYINAHGTSTPENDKMEALGIHRLLGTRAGLVPISSVKSMIGHTLAAAGAIEAVCTVMSVATGQLPPTINHLRPDPEIGLDVVPNQARSVRVRVALSNSFGFGGQNVSIAIGGPR